MFRFDSSYSFFLAIYAWFSYYLTVFCTSCSEVQCTMHNVPRKVSHFPFLKETFMHLGFVLLNGKRKQDPIPARSCELRNPISGVCIFTHFFPWLFSSTIHSSHCISTINPYLSPVCTICSASIIVLPPESGQIYSWRSRQQNLTNCRSN